MGDWDGGTGQDGLEPLGDEARLVLSASSIATFLRCGLQWEFGYVKKIKHPPSLKQGLGLASHSAYENDMLVKLNTGENAPEDVVLDVFNEEFLEYNRQGFLRTKEEDQEEDPIKARDNQIKVIQKQHREIAPLIVPVLVEESFLFQVNGIHYGGTLDLFDAEGKLRDWKNVAQKPAKGTGYMLGMVGYAVGYRHLSGQREREVQIDFLVRYKKQDPGYFPVSSGGPITDEAISGWASVVERVYNAIMAGNFVANGLQNNACSWCGFRSICPAQRR